MRRYYIIGMEMIQWYIKRVGTPTTENMGMSLPNLNIFMGEEDWNK